jgi:hypothetical protein
MSSKILIFIRYKRYPLYNVQNLFILSIGNCIVRRRKLYCPHAGRYTFENKETGAVSIEIVYVDKGLFYTVYTDSTRGGGLVAGDIYF